MSLTLKKLVKISISIASAVVNYLFVNSSTRKKLVINLKYDSTKV